MDKKFVTQRDFNTIHKKINTVFHDVIPKIASNATNEIIKNNLPQVLVKEIMKERDTYEEINNVITVHLATRSLTVTLSSADLQHKLCLKMKRSLQDRADDIELWEVLRYDDAPPEGEKRAKRMEATLRDTMSNQFKDTEEYAYHLEQTKNYMENQIHGNFKERSYILSLHKIHVVPFPEDDLEEKLKRWVRKEFKTFNKEARLSIQHWKDLWHKRRYKLNQRRVRDNPEEYFLNYRITEVVRITIDQQHGLNYIERIIVMRENDKPDSFSEADFKYLNTNDIEYLYYLCLKKKVDFRKNKLKNSLITFVRSYVIWERVHDF
ncbi:hypothetical protein Tco_0480403 [Tanacetum coccineum]